MRGKKKGEAAARAREVAQEVASATQQLAEYRAKEQARKSKAQHQVAVEQLADLQEQLDIALDVRRQERAARKRYEIKPRERSATEEATAVCLLSDLHPEERVDPETIDGLNEYSLEIARQRMAQLAIGLRWMLELVRERSSPFQTGYRIHQLLLPLLGDVISNEIHPELMATNTATPPDAILFVQDIVETFIRYVLEKCPEMRIHCPCVSGNHDRIDPKLHHNNRERRSYSWILYHQLARIFRDDPRVTFEISKGAQLYTPIYGHEIRWTHGDSIRYGGGVGGLTIPLRKALDAWNDAHKAHITCMGHWHTFHDLRDAVVNSSLIGYTPFSRDVVKARFEPAAQAFFLVDKRRGKRIATPIQVQPGESGWS